MQVGQVQKGKDMERLRVKFSRGEELKFISHLDIIRLWEKAFRRAGIPLAYSQGFSPHPQISLAVPLSLGMTSEAELMDVFCYRAVSPQWFKDAVNRQLPAGIEILQVQSVSTQLPSLQSSVRFASYRVEIQTEKTEKEVSEAIDRFMELASLPWHHQRDTGVRNYDLRLLVDDISLIEVRNGRCVLSMKLRCDTSGSGRPDQVLLALGFNGRADVIHRTGLFLEIIPSGDKKQGFYGHR